ncbi:hypothetical protein B0H17DRAFT_1242920 [Mycena rosella]|uniref:Uncharacterized protein n=1 Tax=Mycena rosella TaxID=1033263 RepID=A0AAD7D0P7_MYCRO|nr:hypothetical protein B0H17DRAFT_1242920 [Mycena rosella]
MAFQSGGWIISQDEEERRLGLFAVPVTGTAVVSTGVQRVGPFRYRPVAAREKMSTGRDGSGMAVTAVETGPLSENRRIPGDITPNLQTNVVVDPRCIIKIRHRWSPGDGRHFSGRRLRNPTRCRSVEVFRKASTERVGHPSHGTRRTGATGTAHSPNGDLARLGRKPLVHRKSHQYDLGNKSTDTREHRIRLDRASSLDAVKVNQISITGRMKIVYGGFPCNTGFIASKMSGNWTHHREYAKSIQSDWDSSELLRLSRVGGCMGCFNQSIHLEGRTLAQESGIKSEIHQHNNPYACYRHPWIRSSGVVEFQPLDIKVKSTLSAVRDTIRRPQRDEKGPIDKEQTTWEGADEWSRNAEE